MNDLVDIILENDTYRTKLLLTNVKNAKNGIYYDQVVNKMKERYKTREEDFPFDISQTREKFKRSINICRETAMKIKKMSGIQRFQVEKSYGIWFGKLMPFVSSIHSCQPQQAIEASNIEQIETTESTDESPQGSSTDDTNTKSKRKGAFVPIHETAKKKRKYPISEDLISEIHETMSGFRDALKNDPTKELTQLLREDSERQAKNDQMFLQLLQSMIVNNNQAGNPVFQKITRSQHPVSVVMNSDFSKEHPPCPDTPVFHQQLHGMSRQIIASSQNITGHPSSKHHGSSFPADLSDLDL